MQQEFSKRVHQVQANTGHTEWVTPPYILDAARSAMYSDETGGNIELDPATTPLANSVVRALRIYTAEDNGLALPWDARNVWLNPPYTRKGMEAFVDKLVAEYEAERFGELIAITNAATDTQWAKKLGLAASAICLLEGRVRFLRQADDGQFYTPKNGSLQGQMVWYVSPHYDPDRFGMAFEQLGNCFWR